MEVLASASIPLAAHKASMAVTFLGIMVDTILFQKRLPPEKVTQFQERWRSGVGGICVLAKGLE